MPRSRSRSPDDRRDRKRMRTSSGDRRGRGRSRSRSPTPLSDDDRYNNKSEEDKREKKPSKESKKKEKIASYYGYTPETNPFGDANLYKPFIWGKKIEKDKKEGHEVNLSKKAFTEKRIAMKEEVDKVKERRMIRESEKEERDRLREEEERLKDASLFGDWEEKEEEFHRKQAKTRSKIRIREGREKPIDILAKNVLLFDGDEDDDNEIRLDDVDISAEINDPHLIFKGLPMVELLELQNDIKIYFDMQKDTKHVIFWQALQEVCKDEIEQAQLLSSGPHGGMHKAVREELIEMFDGKSCDELNQMAREISTDLKEGKGDVEYWESVLKECKLASARARLHEVHVSMLAHRLETLRRTKREMMANEMDVEIHYTKEKTEPLSTIREEEYDDEEGNVSPTLIPFDSETMPVSFVATRGIHSPKYLSDNEEYLEGEEDVDEDVDKRNLQLERAIVKKKTDHSRKKTNNEDMLEDSDAMYEAERSKKMEEDEDNMGDVVDLEKANYWWQDKYKPRKPRYLNRVKTAYDWSQYNRVHYDTDNPPPKTVQGYKFSVFYPDLIDKTKTPSYSLEAADSVEFCIIRFHAGPPYEDIAFKIVAKEWEHGKKQGFKCVFERGVLQLFFNFKRHRYRR